MIDALTQDSKAFEAEAARRAGASAQPLGYGSSVTFKDRPDPKLDPKLDPRMDPRMDPGMDLGRDVRKDPKIDPRMGPRMESNVGYQVNAPHPGWGETPNFNRPGWGDTLNFQNRDRV